MAAAHALMTVVCEAGSHIVLPGDLYGGTYRLVDKVLAVGGSGMTWLTNRTSQRSRTRSAATRA